MHIILGILGTLAAIMFAISRFSANARQLGKGAQDLGDAAQTLSNLPRKMRHRRKAGKEGLDLVETPVEAATVLMIAVARMDGMGRVSDTQVRKIESQLVDNMQLNPEDASDYVVQFRSLTSHLKQPDSALYPMVDLLRKTIGREEARQLSIMVQIVGETDDGLNSDQENLIRRFDERMGIMV